MASKVSDKACQITMMAHYFGALSHIGARVWASLTWLAKLVNIAMSSSIQNTFFSTH